MRERKPSAIFIALSALMFVSFLFAQASPEDLNQWQELEAGLEFGKFKVEHASVAGDSTITILRIDPQIWKLKIFCASQEENSDNHTPIEWCEKYGLVTAINAGMFNQDFKTHTGFLKAGTHLNNPKSNHYLSAVAFSPKRTGLPLFRIYDLEDIEIDQLKKDYEYVTQNLRLIKRPCENRWSQQPKMWSEAALGEDSQGRVLFIFCRSPYTMHDFNEILLSLPIDLVCAQHLEGGPEAQLYLKDGGTKLELVGSFETSFNENDNNKKAWRVPNVIGILKREQ